MTWWQWYLFLSVSISLVFTICETIYFNRNPDEKPEGIDDDIEEAIKGGHIQREVFGDRVVLYPKDDEGEVLLKGIDIITNLRHKQKTLFFIFTVLFATVVWPYEIYDFARHYFSSAD
ncbi:MAG: hypothetical protein UU67_C0075G0002 [Candidatus Daviesbacteria bacterium GW2011_GWB1_41_5]|uniref:Uncharacterized protein n=1 Tax=Candidatus Daviesbacteria bacterium GW2011_GWB1_41_5 TaxID=1618429 RepID=A0A0G0WH37_9BACT|nr:MAG: hypothetical protein UU67_C0075G0002 [Candidatus Daviesbacteria bacterium GW2011_GWB1_41_5]